MHGTMWVESELEIGSKFFFTITSQVSPMTMDTTLTKMQPFTKHRILFVDTLYDRTGVALRIAELGLKANLIHDVMEVSEKASCPHVDTILVDSFEAVRHRPRGSLGCGDGCKWELT